MPPPSLASVLGRLAVLFSVVDVAFLLFEEATVAGVTRVVVYWVVAAGITFSQGFNA